ncbi:type IV pilus assembly protein PilN [Salirhabdus euzebyi]|uniref:Type IV pilus assembly protein PilN n=1 Tax=Salirhabdus euzebyi TaxID=394506 RepID=A0A841Q9H4_9BACI|nr:PilN domain-containing protein [Salirhabdus euzebyi]MBB6455060.1 type IV pilus assembly protein PilN [Salirhabdus euzebyi]
MLVDINLLQNKERKNKAFLLLLGFLIVLVGATVFGTFYVTSQIKEDITQTESQIEKVQAERLELQELLQTAGISDFQKLEKTVSELKKYPINSDGLIRSTSKLLPENGYFQSFQYSGDQLVLEVFVQDDMDAAYYLNHLAQQQWINAVKLLTVSTNNQQQQQEEQASPYIAQYDIMINKELLRGDKEVEVQ